MMNKSNQIVAIALAASIVLSSTSLSAQANDGESVSTPMNKSTRNEVSNVKPGRLLFFMNPNGRPCQMQDKILQGSKADIEKSAKIVYLKTTNRDDLKNFYKYGIRGLPAMILESSDGKVIHRFPLGIQSKATILEKLKLTAKK